MTNSTTRLHTGFRGRRHVRGIAAVEFIIGAPVILFVMLATAEIGRAFVQYDTLSYAVRNGARYATENVIAGTSGALDIGKVAGPAANVTVYGAPAGGTKPCLPGFDARDNDGNLSGVTVRDAGDGNVEVIGSYGYRPMLGIALPAFGETGPTAFTMRISVTMRAIS